MNVASVGDAGASCLGYFTGTFSPEGRCLLAHGFTGVRGVWGYAGMCNSVPHIG